MEKIKLITDTTSDLPDEYTEKYAIDLLAIPLTIDGEGYYERESFTSEEFYDILENAEEIPKTSRITEIVYLAAYEKAFHENYTHIFVITINATGSGTNASAQQAVATFYEKNPTAKGNITITVIDSKTYSAGYGHALVLGGEKIKEGIIAKKLEEFFRDWFDCADIYLACYSLKYAKKSGRINAAAAFVGEMLGVRPIIRMVDGSSTVVSKARGDRGVVDKLFEQYKKVKPSADPEVVIVHGRNLDEGKKLRKLIEKDLGRSVPLYTVGTSVMINAGPDICAFVIKGKKRS